MNFGRPNATTSTFNQRIALNKFRIVSNSSILGLYVSQTLLFLGILLVLFNSFDLVGPGHYLETMNWIMITVFYIGLLINFISIPALYFSSFNNFKREIDFWDKETFWILPFFLLGMLCLYASDIFADLVVLPIVFLVVIIVHTNFLLRARKCLVEDHEKHFSRKDQYFITLKYLSAYYFIAAILFIFYKSM